MDMFDEDHHNEPLNNPTSSDSQRIGGVVQSFDSERTEGYEFEHTGSSSTLSIQQDFHTRSPNLEVDSCGHVVTVF